jgi:hypothetical protein
LRFLGSPPFSHPPFFYFKLNIYNHLFARRFSAGHLAWVLLFYVTTTHGHAACDTSSATCSARFPSSDFGTGYAWSDLEPKVDNLVEDLMK